MKLTLILSAGVMLFVSCTNSDTETTSVDSTMTSGAIADSTTTAAGTSASLESFDESASYVSLQTNKPVKVKKDLSRGYIVDYETNEPLNYYFYNPATRDTFDYSGNVVNSYLIRSDDGSYTLDEARWRTKIDDDGDVKAKDGDETKIKVDGNGTEVKIKDDTSKEKLDGDKYKSKTPTSKTKTKDGKTTVKNN